MLSSASHLMGKKLEGGWIVVESLKDIANQQVVNFQCLL